MPRISAIALICAAVGPVPAAFGEPLHGRALAGVIDAQNDAQSLAASLGARTRNDVVGDLRLAWEPRWGAWSFALHYQLTFDAGDTPRLVAREAEAGFGAPEEPPTLFDLSDPIAERSRFSASQRIDRLSIGYSGAHIVLRAGRQALTWGSGFVFSPMDLVDPFAPDAVDTEYKSGADMVYGQLLFDDGADVQFVAAPRPKTEGHWPTANASSFALHYHGEAGALQTTALLARDHGDWTLGAGIGSGLGGGAWNVEVVPTLTRDSRVYVSALANFSNATTISDRNVTFFAEYFRNGFGSGHEDIALADLPTPLSDRLARGQLFNTGRDYLAVGATVEISPLLRLTPTLIQNLDDGGRYWFAQAVYSVRENLNLVVGARTPDASSGTEFGGRPLSGTGPPFLGPPVLFYAQVRSYF